MYKVIAYIVITDNICLSPDIWQKTLYQSIVNKDIIIITYY